MNWKFWVRKPRRPRSMLSTSISMEQVEDLIDTLTVRTESGWVTPLPLLELKEHVALRDAKRKQER